MNKKNLILFIGLFLSLQGFVQAQESNGIELNVGADIMSRYVWRGTQFGGTSPSLQPYLSLTANNFEVGFWGAYSLGGENTYQEFDLYLAYTFANGMFTATITDYFFPEEGADYKYFDYKESTTGHVFEGMLSFNGTEKLPLSLTLAVNFHGADAEKIEDNPGSADFNTRTGIQYSTYLELGYSTTFKDFSLDFFAGGTFTSPNEANIHTGYIGETGFYGDDAGIVNLGITASKEVAITENFSLPISASIITNPQAESVYFVFGISL